MSWEPQTLKEITEAATRRKRAFWLKGVQRDVRTVEQIALLSGRIATLQQSLTLLADSPDVIVQLPLPLPGMEAPSSSLYTTARNELMSIAGQLKTLKLLPQCSLRCMYLIEEMESFVEDLLDDFLGLPRW